MSKAREFLNETEMWEMSRLSKERSNLPTVLFLRDSKPQSKKPGPVTLKVSNNKNRFDKKDNFTLSVSDNPEILVGTSRLKSKELKEIKNWVSQNKDLITKLWNEEIDFADFIQQMKTS